MTTPPVPLILSYKNQVYNVGSMRPEDQGTCGYASHEGHHLSVSECPEQWISVAKLGGRPPWLLTRKGGTAVFIDALRTEHQMGFRNALTTFALSEGLPRRSTAGTRGTATRWATPTA